MTTILLIEDDLTLRENTSELLELIGYKVITAKNGKEGIEFAQTYLPNIIICDILMPVLNGYDVLNTLTQDHRTKYIPFIFLSAKTERKDIRKGMNLGADDYITKPFTEDELTSTIESRLAKTLILKEFRETNIKDTKSQFEYELETLNDLKIFFDDNGKELLFTKGEFIYEEGGNSNYVYLISKGAVKTSKIDIDGKELGISLYEDDEIFGYTSFSHNIPYQETAIALSDVELAAITKEKLKEVLDSNHKITFELIQLLTDNLSSLKNQLLEMAYSSVNKRTANTIIKFADKINKRTKAPIRITRNDLASVAGIAKETLSRTLSKFKKEGLIEVEGRTIKIVDLKRMRDIL